jgi:hypothetical protein
VTTSLIFPALLAVLSPPPTTAASVVEAPAVAAPEAAGAVDGLFPLWEQTAVLHAPGALQIGYGHAEVGLGVVQVGTAPILDLHGTVNAEAKVAMVRGPRLQLALVVGAYHLPTAAESRTVGNLNPTGFANPYSPVWLIPISVAKTLRLGRTALHWTSTVLVSRSPDPAYRTVSGGQTVLFELFASPRWAARAHGGVEGWPVAPQAHLGLSFGYTAPHLYLAAGAARRFSFDGEAANMVLVDGGLLFR